MERFPSPGCLPRSRTVLYPVARAQVSTQIAAISWFSKVRGGGGSSDTDTDTQSQIEVEVEVEVHVHVEYGMDMWLGSMAGGLLNHYYHYLYHY